MLPLRRVRVGASNDYAKLGSTHHCFEDINTLSNYEDINLFIPSNEIEFKHLFNKFYNDGSINYFRIGEKKIKLASRQDIMFQKYYLTNKTQYILFLN